MNCSIHPDARYNSFGDERAFVSQADLAFCEAESCPGRVLLMGINPDAPEQGYGWIELGAQLNNDPCNALFEVRRLWEKPAPRPVWLRG
jgi:mannose-1-phosphate guanylyltransferase